jgi:hypothetical protein
VNFRAIHPEARVATFCNRVGQRLPEARPTVTGALSARLHLVDAATRRNGKLS